MTCQEAVALLSDYIDDALAPPRRTALEAHLADCQGCHVVLDSTQCTILLSRAAGATALSGERRRHLLSRLEAACGGCSRPKKP